MTRLGKIQKAGEGKERKGSKETKKGKVQLRNKPACNRSTNEVGRHEGGEESEARNKMTQKMMKRL